MRKRQVILTAVSIVLVGGFLWSANSVHAELISAINNPSFETTTLSDGGTSTSVTDWEEAENGATNSTFTKNPVASESPDPTDGENAALLIIRSNTSPNNTESRIWQSLGTVATGDVGQIIDVSADMYARVQDSSKIADMRMFISTGVTSSSTGTSLTWAGDTTMTEAEGVREFAIEYTVLSSDLDNELFLQFILSDSTPTGGSEQYYVDNVNYEVVPEPSTFVLLGIGALALLFVRRRRR